MEEHTSEEPEPLSAEEIVTLLRSDSGEDRNRALAELYPEGGGAMLFQITPLVAHAAWTPEVDAGRMFTTLLQMAQQLGRNLGMQLQWVRGQEDPNRIVIPGGHHG